MRADCPWAMSHGYAGNRRSDRGRLAQWLVPHRRRLPARRRGQFLFRRSAEGRDPPARREHLLVRGRIRNPRPSRRARGGRRRRSRARSPRTRSWRWSRVKPGETLRSRRADRVPPSAHGAFHDPALRPRRRGAAAHADREDREGEAARRRPDRRHLGPREGGHRREARKDRRSGGRAAGRKPMFPELSPRAESLREKLAAFMAEHIYPQRGASCSPRRATAPSAGARARACRS